MHGIAWHREKEGEEGTGKRGKSEREDETGSTNKK